MPPKVFGKAPRLHDMRTTADIWWSPSWCHPGQHYGGGGNSYVLLEPAQPCVPKYRLHLDGRPVVLASINGIGEIRWDVSVTEIRWALERLAKEPDVMEHPGKGDFVEFYKAFKHFGLTLPEEV